MPLDLSWYDVAIRLALTVLAGALVGLNRSESGRAAGLRTTILVCLASSTSMIQVNLLLSMRGKAPDSFNVLDLMRLPLGILTGMGFIGGGVILRRGNIIHGVTTAASLWLVTVIGLCLGGGQLVLGMAALGIALVVLWTLKWCELRIRQDRRAVLSVICGEDGPAEAELRAALHSAGFDLESWEVTYERHGGSRRCTIRSQVRWRGRAEDRELPALVERLRQEPGVRSLRWSG